MGVLDPNHLYLRTELRRYVCPICGAVRVIEVRRIDKSVVVCVHEDSRGGNLPVIQLREEGRLIPPDSSSVMA